MIDLKVLLFLDKLAVIDSKWAERGPNQLRNSIGIANSLCPSAAVVGKEQHFHEPSNLPTTRSTHENYSTPRTFNISHRWARLEALALVTAYHLLWARVRVLTAQWVLLVYR